MSAQVKGPRIEDPLRGHDEQAAHGNADEESPDHLRKASEASAPTALVIGRGSDDTTGLVQIRASVAAVANLPMGHGH
jgi:hypothetical protein